MSEVLNQGLILIPKGHVAMSRDICIVTFLLGASGIEMEEVKEWC